MIRSELRHKLKARRRNVTHQQSLLAAKKIAQLLWRSVHLKRNSKLAVYLATPTEINCSEIIKGANLRNLRIFAPVLSGKKILFAPLKPGIKMQTNRYGIAEPYVTRKKLVTPANIDAVVVPMLGFDSSGNRMGMGGGYYDRSFAFRKRRKAWRKPLLIGAAYSFQEIDAISVENWDVPMDIIITEQKLLKNKQIT